jgi:ligand-binding sensor domain-containing protein/AAA+ ATPase superfamily predicted ATPase
MSEASFTLCNRGPSLKIIDACTKAAFEVLQATKQTPLPNMKIRVKSPASRKSLQPIYIAIFLAIASVIAFHSRAHQTPQVNTATITGAVQDDKGTPLEKVNVTLSSPNYSASAITTADGKFEFKNLQPAKYLVTAQAARFRKTQSTVTIAKVEEIVPILLIKLFPSSLHVAVYDANNQSLGGVSVSLYTQDSATSGNPTARTLTDKNGDAYFGRLAPGSYTLTAVLRDYDEYRNQVFISSDITTEFALQLLVAPVIPVNTKAIARYNVPNLPSKNVRAIFQDSEGWIWFGTDKGLARYNGADFKSSTGAGSAYALVSNEDVRSIAEDASGRIWIATAKGLRRITKEGADEGQWLSNVEARKIALDANGNVWIATTAGVFKFDGKELETFDEGRALPSNDVRALVIDKTDKVWLATANGIATIADGKINVPEQKREALAANADGNPALPANQSRPSASRAAQATTNNQASSSTSTQQNSQAATANSSVAGKVSDLGDVQNLFLDKAGNLWIASSKGAIFFDGNSANSFDLTQARVANVSPVQSIHQDRTGHLWFALANGGALLYDTTTSDTQRISLLDQDHVFTIANEREGCLWFATDNGAVYADLYSFINFTTSRGLSDNDVQAIVEGPKEGNAQLHNAIWCITSTGASRMQDERFVPIERFRANLRIQGVAFDDTGAAWFATDQGAIRLSGKTLTQFSEGNGLASSNIRYVSSIAKGAALVFATAKGASIYQDGVFRKLDALDGYDARQVYEDADGRLWFATSRGLMLYNRQSESAVLLDTAHGLLDNDTRWITRFNGELMVATRAGVQIYNERQQSASSFDSEPASTLFVDRDNFLWVGTDNGQVKKFAVVEGHIVSSIYSGEIHWLTANKINSFYEDHDGHIWIATDKGVVRHTPVRTAPSTRVSLKLDGRVDIDSASNSYELPNGRQRVVFHLTGVSMSKPVQYLYRINPEGGNERWELLPVQAGLEREISVFDLNEGANTFEVMALNRDLYGGLAPTSSISVIVDSPFYKKWWFYLFGLVAVGSATTAIFVARKKSQREYVLPKELREYVAIEPNPYIVGNPIRSEQMFFGREDDFRYVRTKLEGASQGVVIVFCGERRVGKSSILFQVMNGRLGERFIPVFVDMQEMVITSDAEFFARMSRLIVESLARKTIAITAPGFDHGNPYHIFLDFLDAVLAAINDHTLLILLDEYELMEAKVDDGKLSQELFTFLAGLMDNKERLAFIFTGSRRLEERDKKYWRELLRRSLFRKVGFFSGKDTVRLITDPVEGRVIYGRGVIEAICRLTAGQPFYTQVTCQNIVDYMNENQQNWITLADLQYVTADITDNPLPQMIYTWDALSDDEKLVMSLLADILQDGNDFATAYDLRAYARSNEYPMNLSETTIRMTLEEMFRRELLDKNPSEGFRIKIDLLRLWIRRSHSIWQVVKEVRTL